MKCSECKRNATYDAPRSLCKRHWAEWFVGKAKDTTVGQKWVKSIVRQKPMTERDVLIWIAEEARKFYMRPSKATRISLRAALCAAGQRPRLRKALKTGDQK